MQAFCDTWWVHGQVTGGACAGGGEDEEGARGLLVGEAARLLGEGHGADVQLLDLVDAADCHGALLGQRQAVREAAAVEVRHEIHLRHHSRQGSRHHSPQSGQ